MVCTGSTHGVVVVERGGKGKEPVLGVFWRERREKNEGRGEERDSESKVKPKFE